MLICPSCRKSYKTGRLTCTRCGIELLPPSAIQLQDRHPSLARNPYPHKKTQQEEAYVELLRCSLNEAKEIQRLLEPEGISCRIERNEDFRFQYRLEGGSQIADQEGLIIKVKATELSKARALVEWEFQKELEAESLTPGTPDEMEQVTCPFCEAEVSPDDEICPECGLNLDTQQEEEDQEPYRCLTCGTPRRIADPICPTCGARFHH